MNPELIQKIVEISTSLIGFLWPAAGLYGITAVAAAKILAAAAGGIPAAVAFVDSISSGEKPTKEQTEAAIAASDAAYAEALAAADEVIAKGAQ